MPDFPTPHSLLAGLDLGGLFERSVGRTPVASGARGTWEPPAPGEIAPFFPGYEVGSLLGRGGMGAVYRARQIDLHREVAIKVLPVEISADEAFAERFRREARTLARLQHRHIVAVFDSGTTAAGHAYFVMEYVEGGDLASALRRGPLPPAETLRILRETCTALEAAHAQGIVHRDIKPSNILLTTERRVKVVDFGLAVPVSAPELKLTRSGVAVGTFEYSAPEQRSGEREIDERVDLYSLGVTAYELLTGQLPCGVFDPPSKKSGLPAAYDDVILRALANEPGRRYASATAFREALERPARTERRVRRLTRVSIGMGLLGTVAIVASVVAWQQRDGLRRSEQAALTAQLEAEGLVDFMLTDLRGKLERVGRLDALEDVVRRADAAFARVPEGARGQAFEVRRAHFFHTKGVVLRVLKKWPEAREAFARAQQIAARLAAEAPASVDLRVQAVAAQRELGEFGMLSRDYDGALAGYDEALRQAEEAVRLFPDSPELGHLLALAHLGRGRAFGYQRKLDESIVALRRGGEVIEALRRRWPDDLPLRQSAAWMEGEIGSWEEHGGTLEAALEHFQRLKQLNVELARDAVNDAGVVGAQLRLATVLNKLGRPAEALAEAEAARPCCEAMAREKPSNREAAQMLDWDLDATATALAALGRQEEADDFIERRRQLNASVGNPAEAPPTDPLADGPRAVEAAFSAAEANGAGEGEHAAWRDASEAHGRQLAELGRRAEALAHFSRWAGRLREKAAGAPVGSLWHADLAHTLNRLGGLHEESREWPAALGVYAEALRLRECVLAAAGPAERPSRLYQVLSAHQHVDDALRHAGTADAQAENVRAMLALAPEVTPEHAYGPRWLQILAETTGAAARRLVADGRGSDAQALADFALSRAPHWSPEQCRAVRAEAPRGS